MITEEKMSKIERAQWIGHVSRDISTIFQREARLLTDADRDVWGLVYHDTREKCYFFLPQGEAIAWTGVENPPLDTMERYPDAVEAMRAGKRIVIEAARRQVGGGVAA